MFGMFDNREKFTGVLQGYLALPPSASRATADGESTEESRSDICRDMLRALSGNLGSSPCSRGKGISVGTTVVVCSGIILRGASQEDHFWDACNGLIQSTDGCMCSTYTVGDGVRCFFYLVEDVVPPMIPIVM